MFFIELLIEGARSLSGCSNKVAEGFSACVEKSFDDDFPPFRNGESLDVSTGGHGVPWTLNCPTIDFLALHASGIELVGLKIVRVQ